jgi:hypothetical protein
MTSDVSIRNLKLRYLILDLKIMTSENPGRSVRNELTQTDPDLVDDEDLRPQTDPPND